MGKRDGFSTLRASLRALSWECPLLPMSLRARVTLRRDGNTREWGASVALMPLARLSLGVVLALAAFAAARVWSAPACVVPVWLLGLVINSTKLDSVADWFDGVALRRTPEQTLEIIQDPRLGAMGSLALVAVVVAELALLIQVPADRLGSVLAASMLLGGMAGTRVLFGARPADPESRRIKRFTEGLTADLYAAACAVTIAGSVLLLGVVRGLVAFLVVVLLAGAYQRVVVRRLGGVVGDAAGAAEQLATLLVILLEVAR